MTLAEAAFVALVHFEALDRSNAAIHCAPDVRYSPITFRLAEALDATAGYDERPEVRAVLAHSGLYEEDKGR